VGGGSDEAPATGGNGNGVASPGTCVMGSTGTGGFGGVGGVGGTNSTGATGGTTRGGSDGNGGSDPDAANDEGDVVYTNGGCSLATPSDHSAFAALIVALAALVRFGRRRRANANAR
jgi:MYXO-CTERM domain-containing protein